MTRQLTEVVPRKWLYGLTADEWLHLAAEDAYSEVGPCCGNLGLLRELLNDLATFQAPDNWGWRLAIGRRVLQAAEMDGDEHGLQDRVAFPLLHRVLDGIREEQASPGPVRVLSGSWASSCHRAPVVMNCPPFNEPRCGSCGHRVPQAAGEVQGLTVWAAPVPSRNRPARTWPGELAGRLIARRACVRALRLQAAREASCRS